MTITPRHEVETAFFYVAVEGKLQNGMKRFEKLFFIKSGSQIMNSIAKTMCFCPTTHSTFHHFSDN